MLYFTACTCAFLSLCAFFLVRFFSSALFSHALIYICAFFLCAFFQCAFFRSPLLSTHPELNVYSANHCVCVKRIAFIIIIIIYILVHAFKYYLLITQTEINVNSENHFVCVKSIAYHHYDNFYLCIRN